jgi:hypothetical protein
VIFKEALGVALIIVPSSQLASRNGRKKLASRNSVGYLIVCVIKNYGAASAWALASDTSATVGWESNQTSALRFKVREQMLRACCEQCCEKVVCNIQTSVGLLPPPSCCDHVATILLVLRATSNIRSFPSPSSTQKPTSHVCNIETQHPQH